MYKQKDKKAQPHSRNAHVPASSPRKLLHLLRPEHLPPLLLAHLLQPRHLKAHTQPKTRLHWHRHLKSSHSSPIRALDRPAIQPARPALHAHAHADPAERRHRAREDGRAAGRVGADRADDGARVHAGREEVVEGVLQEDVRDW